MSEKKMFSVDKTELLLDKIIGEKKQEIKITKIKIRIKITEKDLKRPLNINFNPFEIIFKVYNNFYYYKPYYI